MYRDIIIKIYIFQDMIYNTVILASSPPTPLTPDTNTSLCTICVMYFTSRYFFGTFYVTFLKNVVVKFVFIMPLVFYPRGG